MTLNQINSNKSFSDVSIIGTEIEYAPTNHRSFYDLLNRFVILVLKNVIAEMGQHSPQELPDSFRKVAEKGITGIIEKYKVPKSLAAFYVKKEKMFSMLRNVRDAIIHKGQSLSLVFHFEDRFGYEIESGILSELREFGLWSEKRLKHNQIGSLLELFALLVQDMLDGANDLAKALRECFGILPEPVAPGFHIYYRSEMNSYIKDLASFRLEPWIDPKGKFAS